jgi:hypothetical protein
MQVKHGRAFLCVTCVDSEPVGHREQEPFRVYSEIEGHLSMRTFMLMLTVAVLGLAGCAGEDTMSSQATPAASAASGPSSGYMTTEQSSKLIMLPGDSTTLVQMQYLSGQ